MTTKFLFKRRLFLKIFLWFWFAFWLTNAVFVLVSFAAQTDLFPARILTVKTQGTAAAMIYENGGEQYLKEFLSRSATETQIRGFLFDKQGRELSANDAPAIVREVFEKTAAKSDGQTQSFGTQFYSGFEIQTARGAQFIFVGEMSRLPSLAILNVAPQTRFWRLSLTIFVSGLICFSLARYLTAPIVKLSRTARQFSEGKLDVRVGGQFERRRDELAQLGADFDRMAERIENLIVSQKRLLNDISHELRSPLARLGIALDLARDTDETARAAAFDVIEREATRLNQQIEQLLLFARLENGTAEIEVDWLDLSELIAEIVADANFEAVTHNRRVRIVQTEFCIVRGNAASLRSGLENVIRNGVRYTTENTSVDIALTCDKNENGQNVRVTVRDHGAGLPDEELDKIFTPYYRVTKGRERDSGGTGLGLTIAANVARFHNGKVTAANASGGGLIVTFNFAFTNQ